MKNYQVTVTEKLEMTIEIEASSQNEAEHFVEKRWENSDYILDANHFKGVEFTAKPYQKEREIEL